MHLDLPLACSQWRFLWRRWVGEAGGRGHCRLYEASVASRTESGQNRFQHASHAGADEASVAWQQQHEDKKEGAVAFEQAGRAGVGQESYACGGETPFDRSQIYQSIESKCTNQGKPSGDAHLPIFKAMAKKSTKDLPSSNVEYQKASFCAGATEDDRIRAGHHKLCHTPYPHKYARPGLPTGRAMNAQGGK